MDKKLKWEEDCPEGLLEEPQRRILLKTRYEKISTPLIDNLIESLWSVLSSGGFTGVGELGRVIGQAVLTEPGYAFIKARIFKVLSPPELLAGFSQDDVMASATEKYAADLLGFGKVSKASEYDRAFVYSAFRDMVIKVLEVNANAFGGAEPLMWGLYKAIVETKSQVLKFRVWGKVACLKEIGEIALINNLVKSKTNGELDGLGLKIKFMKQRRDSVLQRHNQRRGGGGVDNREQSVLMAMGKGLGHEMMDEVQMKDFVLNDSNIDTDSDESEGEDIGDDMIEWVKRKGFLDMGVELEELLKKLEKARRQKLRILSRDREEEVGLSSLLKLRSAWAMYLGQVKNDVNSQEQMYHLDREVNVQKAKPKGIKDRPTWGYAPTAKPVYKGDSYGLIVRPPPLVKYEALARERMRMRPKSVGVGVRVTSAACDEDSSVASVASSSSLMASVTTSVVVPAPAVPYPNQHIVNPNPTHSILLVKSGDPSSSNVLAANIQEINKNQQPMTDIISDIQMNESNSVVSKLPLEDSIATDSLVGEQELVPRISEDEISDWDRFAAAGRRSNTMSVVTNSATDDDDMTHHSFVSVSANSILTNLSAVYPDGMKIRVGETKATVGAMLSNRSDFDKYKLDREPGDDVSQGVSVGNLSYISGTSTAFVAGGNDTDEDMMTVNTSSTSLLDMDRRPLAYRPLGGLRGVPPPSTMRSTGVVRAMSAAAADVGWSGVGKGKGKDKEDKGKSDRDAALGVALAPRRTQAQNNKRGNDSMGLEQPTSLSLGSRNTHVGSMAQSSVSADSTATPASLYGSTVSASAAQGVDGEVNLEAIRGEGSTILGSDKDGTTLLGYIDVPPPSLTAPDPTVAQSHMVDMSMANLEGSVRRFRLGKEVNGRSVRTLHAPGRAVESSQWMARQSAKMGQDPNNGEGGHLIHPLVHLFPEHEEAKNVLKASYAIGVGRGEALISDVHHVGSLVARKDVMFGHEFISMGVPETLKSPIRGVPLSQQGRWPDGPPPRQAKSPRGEQGKEEQKDEGEGTDDAFQEGGSIMSKSVSTNQNSDRGLVAGGKAFQEVPVMLGSGPDNQRLQGALRNTLTKPVQRSIVVHPEPAPGGLVGGSQMWATASSIMVSPVARKLLLRCGSGGVTSDMDVFENGNMKIGRAMSSNKLSRARLPAFTGGGWVPDKLRSHQLRQPRPYVFKPMGRTYEEPDGRKPFYGGFG